MTCRPALERALGKLVKDVGFRDMIFRNSLTGVSRWGIEPLKLGPQ